MWPEISKPSGRQTLRRFAPSAYILLLVLCLHPTEAVSGADLLVVLDDSKQTHQLVLENLRTALEANQKTNPSVRIHVQNISTLDDGDSADKDLIVTIGVHAAAQLRRQSIEVPVLNALLPGAAYRELVTEGKPQNAAVLLDQPIERQFAVARAILPSAQTVGILRGPAGAGDVESAAAAAERYDLTLNTVAIGPGVNKANAVQDLVAQNDVIVATFDPEVYQLATAKWLLYLGLQQHRPIIGFSYALLKAGAVAAVFSTPSQVGKHTAELVTGWLDTGDLPSRAVFPRYYHIGINKPIAKRLGMRLPSQAIIEQAVRAMLKVEP